MNWTFWIEESERLLQKTPPLCIVEVRMALELKQNTPWKAREWARKSSKAYRNFLRRKQQRRWEQEAQICFSFLPLDRMLPLPSQPPGFDFFCWWIFVATCFFSWGHQCHSLLCRPRGPSSGMKTPTFVWCFFDNPTCSMYGIFTYIYHKFRWNVGKYSPHGASGNHSKCIGDSVSLNQIVLWSSSFLGKNMACQDKAQDVVQAWSWDFFFEGLFEVVSNIHCLFSSRSLGRWSNLTWENIFSNGLKLPLTWRIIPWLGGPCWSDHPHL